MASSSSSAQSDLHAWHPTEYLRIAYKRRWIAIPGFLLVFVYGAINSLRDTPIYQASTQLLIEKEARRATSIDSALNSENSWYQDDFYPTQQRILESRTLAARTAAALARAGVVERIPNTSSTANVWRGLSSMVSGGKHGDDDVARVEPTSGMIQGGLSVTPIRSSRIFDLSFSSPDPVFAAAAINEVAKQYIQQTVESRFESTKEVGDFLSRQLEEYRQKVGASEQALQSYKEKNNALAVDDKQNIVVQKLTALNQQVIDARLSRIDKQAVYERLVSLRQNGQSLRTLPAVMANPVIQALDADLTKLQTQQAQLAKNYGPEWPEMKAVATSIDATQTKITAEVNRAAAAVEADYLTAKSREAALSSSLEAQKGEAMGLDRKSIEYSALERDAVGNRTLYDNLLARVNETGVSRQFTGSNIEVIDEAEVPGGPVSPNVRRSLTFAAGSGLLFALGLIFAFEYFDSRIKSPEEVKTHLGLSFLGLIPSIAGDSALEAPMLEATTPPAFTEAIRGLRTSVLFSSADENGRTVVVTSTGPSEGKTVVASSLAISLAQSGQRTLIIDVDMRRPRLHEALGRPQEPGLSNVLVGDASIGDATRSTAVEHLWMLSAGHIPPNPAELLGSKKYAALVQQLQEHYDWIIIDAPPVMPVTDATVVANVNQCGVLFVVGAEMTQWQAARQAIDQLKSVNARFLGAVLNNVNVQRHAYYYAPYFKKEYNKYYQRSGSRV